MSNKHLNSPSPKIVQFVPPKLESKTSSTQFNENDFKTTESKKLIIARKSGPNASAKTGKSLANSQNNQKLTENKETQPNTKPKPIIVVSKNIKRDLTILFYIITIYSIIQASGPKHINNSKYNKLLAPNTCNVSTL